MYSVDGRFFWEKRHQQLLPRRAENPGECESHQAEDYSAKAARFLDG